ncbi:MAG: hypothetical protein R6W96_04520, partial [Clostridia bacterium]
HMFLLVKLQVERLFSFCSPKPAFKLMISETIVKPDISPLLERVTNSVGFTVATKPHPCYKNLIIRIGRNDDH